MQESITFSSSQRAVKTTRIDGRRLAGRLAGGAIAGLMAWPAASIVGSLSHLHWLGAAGGLGTAITIAVALGSVDREEAAP